ncbi:hypothetical protein ACIQGZ_07860 [Streptomyces sp. NPDC092296]|uniref:hypothetical protein n=1 Tax=Streptomyces sp. NPDC092296 TaxID=3366012 RepID=UPI003828B34C
MRAVLDAGAALPADRTSPEPAEHLEASGTWAAGPQPDRQLKGRALRTRTRLHGVISPEIEGHFNGMGFDRPPSSRPRSPG